MLKYLSQIWNSADLRRKILFTVFIVFIYRLLAHITVPGADVNALKQLSSQTDLMQIFSILTGGGTENFSVVLMGISPYITASIVIQLLTVIVPKFENLSKEGETGKRKLNSYTRWLTLPLAIFQSYGMIVLLNSQASLPIVPDLNNPAVLIPVMLTITAGTILLVWLGEQISEKGIGNGISILIFIGILSSVPQLVAQSLYLAQNDESKLIPFILMALITIILLIIVILVAEAERKIPLTYAGQGSKGKGQQAFFPIKINQAGMIPIIFAVAMASFPGIIGQFLMTAKSENLQQLGKYMSDLFTSNSAPYLITYFLLIIAFTFFYISITFNPTQIADNIQKKGGYIPGIRPGKQTADYLQFVSRRLTVFGSVFLAFIAISPILTQVLFRSAAVGSVPLLITGAGMIIIVGVVLDLIRQINAQLVMHDYSKFY